ncbi:hypothetical protein BTVI_147576 [Pitangus sulphuratus]|nr:hypothetical protein BTVI_147576 [Pitangus sulphuratus]
MFERTSTKEVELEAGFDLMHVAYRETYNLKGISKLCSLACSKSQCATTRLCLDVHHGQREEEGKRQEEPVRRTEGEAGTSPGHPPLQSPTLSDLNWQACAALTVIHYDSLGDMGISSSVGSSCHWFPRSSNRSSQIKTQENSKRVNAGLGRFVISDASTLQALHHPWRARIRPFQREEIAPLTSALVMGAADPTSPFEEDTKDIPYTGRTSSPQKPLITYVDIQTGHSMKPDRVQEAFGQHSQAHGVILEVSCAEPGVGLDDPDGSLPT